MHWAGCADAHVIGLCRLQPLPYFFCGAKCGPELNTPFESFSHSSGWMPRPGCHGSLAPFPRLCAFHSGHFVVRDGSADILRMDFALLICPFALAKFKLDGGGSHFLEFSCEPLRWRSLCWKRQGLHGLHFLELSCLPHLTAVRRRHIPWWLPSMAMAIHI